MYIGLRRSKSLIIAPGLKSKCLFTSSTSFSSETFPVPNVSTNIDRGLATPIAYDNSISHLSASPAATIFLATYLAA